MHVNSYLIVSMRFINSPNLNIEISSLFFFELLALLHIVRQSPVDSGGLTGLNRTVLPLPKVCIDQSPVQLSPVRLSLVQGGLWWTLPDSGQL